MGHERMNLEMFLEKKKKKKQVTLALFRGGNATGTDLKSEE